MSRKQLAVLLLGTWVAVAVGAVILWRQIEAAKIAMQANRTAIESARVEYLGVLLDIRRELRLIRENLSGEERGEEERR